MSLFSIFKKKEKVLKCDWCKKEIDTLTYTEVFGTARCGFCSESCKQNFRDWYKKMKSCESRNCNCH